MNDQATPTRRIQMLTELDLADAPHAGGKAAVLGHLLRAGFPVPDGFAVTSGEAELSDADIEQLLEAAGQLGDAPLAVRSSCTEEDRPDRSYAGLYDTVLGVRGRSELVAAVRRCLAAVNNPRVRAYATGAPTPDMALLVQPVIDADAAGVAFTANPVTGARDEVVVNAVRGLGDGLAAGTVSPEEWVVRGTATDRVIGPPAIDAAQARAVSDLARRVADHLGAPQDIEWAIRGGDVWLLQARAITALPVPPIEHSPLPATPPPGFWRREESHVPRPRTPMLRSIHPFNEAMRDMAEQFGFLVTVAGQDIGGWSYATVLPAGGRPGAAAPPTWLMRVLARVVPTLRRRVKRCVDAVRAGLAGEFVRRWYHEWRPQLARRIEALREEDLARLDDIALEAHLTAVRRLLADATHIHFLLFGAFMLEVGEFALRCRDLLGWPDQQAIRLLSGLSTGSTEPGRQIGELARTAAGSPAVRTLLAERRDPVTLDELVAADPRFAEEIDAYQRTFGLRAVHYEVAEPTLAELPELLLQLVRDQLAKPGGGPAALEQDLARRRAEAAADARAALADRPADLAQFNESLRRAERAYPVREDNEFFTVSVPLALIRRAALETGRRLAGRGLLSVPGDAFFLEFDEALAALHDSVDVRTVVRRRKGERAWAEAHPGPSSYGTDPGPPPSLEAFPAEVRSAMSALMWGIDALLGQEPKPTGSSAEALAGIAASPGRYRGPVRVITAEHDFPKLRRGDVLVCPMTSPVWSILFPSIGALVTDSGGTLSHPAIIAREHRVPAVVATGHGTQVLRDGQVVTVDGTRGIVEVKP